MVCECRAQNNFQTVTGHVDRPDKFQLGHESFMTSQNVKNIMGFQAKKTQIRARFLCEVIKNKNLRTH